MFLPREFDQEIPCDPETICPCFQPLFTVVLGKRALPQAQRASAPVDVDALLLRYGPDTHWYGQAFKLLSLAMKNNQRLQATD